MKVLIVDDEANARAALRGIINHHFPHIHIIDEVSSVPEAVKSIRKNTPDLVLLDIEMPGYLGTEILDFFDPQEINFSIVFVTAYSNYALKAFDLAAVDYILKPTRVELLDRAIQRAIMNKKHYENYYTLKESLTNNRVEKIALQTAEGLTICETKHIVYLKADGAYTHFIFDDGHKITITKTLQEYEVLEELSSFFRISRSYIINLNNISKVIKKDGGYLIMVNGETINASAEKRQLLYDRIASKII